MLSRVRTISVNTKRLKGLEKEWPRYPVTLRKKGLHAGFLLVDRETGEGLSITLWTSRRAMRASERDPEFKKAYERLRPFFAEKALAYYDVICRME
jgi:heme-degrading monooxygenase HmoA